MEYSDYLKTEHWKLISGAKRQINPRCQRCRSKEELEVHHKFYRSNWYDTKIQDLETLCHGCHVTHHVVDGCPYKEQKLQKLIKKQKPAIIQPHKPVLTGKQAIWAKYFK